jgi:hypothetical protein
MDSTEIPARLGWYVLWAGDPPRPYICLFMPSGGPDLGEVLCDGRIQRVRDRFFMGGRWQGPYMTKQAATAELPASGDPG